MLVIFAGGRQHGLKARSETIEGVEQVIPDSVHYICKFCTKPIYEHQKGFMLTNGEWRPTARPINAEYRSYQISNLMSPIMFFSWTQVMQEFAETDWGQNITKFKNFVIDVLGEPWETQEKKRDWRELKNRSEPYALGSIVPAGGCVLTCGVDVQKNRVEAVVVAWGSGMSSWVIDYQTFFGETKEKNGLVWTGLRDFIINKKYKLRNINLSIALTAIDSGYNPKREGEERQLHSGFEIDHIVYDFVARTPRTIACRGNDGLKDMILKEERVKRQTLLKTRYDVAVTELKDETFIKTDYVPGTPGEIHFSSNLPDEFFKGFLSEVYAEIAPGKWNYKKIYERNEPLDTYILARAAADWLKLSMFNDEAWADYERKLFSK